MPPVERLHGGRDRDRDGERTADYTQALQPITTSQSTKILKELVSLISLSPSLLRMKRGNDMNINQRGYRY